jgi:hypothetical protein
MIDMRRVNPMGWLLAFATLALPLGCEKKTDGDPKNLSSNKKKDDHPDHGPHGGAIAEWGDEEYHVEFTVDHDKRQATVYILGSDVKTARPIDAKEIVVVLDLKDPVTLKLEANPQKGDPGGTASRFSSQHEALGKKIVFKGTITGKVGDMPYEGKFEEEDGHGHGHSH